MVDLQMARGAITSCPHFASKNSADVFGEREKRETKREQCIMDVSDLTFLHPIHRAAALR